MANWKTFAFLLVGALALSACDKGEKGGGGGAPAPDTRNALCDQMQYSGNGYYLDRDGRRYQRSGDRYTSIDDRNRVIQCDRNRSFNRKCRDTEYRQGQGYYHYGDRQYINCTANDIFPVACNEDELNYRHDNNNRNRDYRRHDYWNYTNQPIYPDCSCYGNDYYPLQLTDHALQEYDNIDRRHDENYRRDHRGQGSHRQWRCMSNSNRNYFNSYQYQRMQFGTNPYQFYYLPVYPMSYYYGPRAGFNFSFDFGFWKSEDED